MADSAYRYAGCLASPHAVTGRYTDGPGNVRTAGLSLAQLDEWAPAANGGERNLRQWLLAFRSLQGLGGVQRYSSVEADIASTGTGLDTDEWMQWRSIHWFEEVGLDVALAAEGMTFGMPFWAANFGASGYQTPFARWERDDVWYGTILPQLTLYARALAAEGATVIGIDGELYSYSTGPYGDTSNSGWTANYNGRTCTEAEAHIFARQRGREMADVILAEMPGAHWWSYYTRLPYSNDAIAHGSDTFYITNTSVDFLAGICSNSGWSKVSIVDASFYKDPQCWGNSPGMQQWCDAIRNGQMGQAAFLCSQLSDTEWDGIAAKVCFPPFIWLTQGVTAFEPRLTYAEADVAIRAAAYTTCGGWWYLYTQQTTVETPPPPPPPTGWPDALTSGVQVPTTRTMAGASITSTAWFGANGFSGAGTVGNPYLIDRVLFTDRLALGDFDPTDLTGKYVKITNCRIYGATPGNPTPAGSYGLYIRETGPFVTVEDTTIGPNLPILATGGTSAGMDKAVLAYVPFTARRCNIFGANDMFHMQMERNETTTLIEDSWLHDVFTSAGDHPDMINGNPHASHVVCRHNYIDGIRVNNSYCTEGMAIFDDPVGASGIIEDWELDNNYITRCATLLICSASEARFLDPFVVTDNVFALFTNTRWSGRSPSTQSGNVDELGNPLVF